MLYNIRVHRDYNVRMSEMIRSNLDLSRHSQITEQENLVVKEKVAILMAQIDDLKKNMPKNIMNRMEADSKRAMEQELIGLGEEKDRSKNKTCIIS